ncbi:MAG TPA: hypothetical protein V6C58_05965 [Allocoleopsis sp.]
MQKLINMKKSLLCLTGISFAILSPLMINVKMAESSEKAIYKFNRHFSNVWVGEVSVENIQGRFPVYPDCPGDSACTQGFTYANSAAKLVVPVTFPTCNSGSYLSGYLKVKFQGDGTGWFQKVWNLNSGDANYAGNLEYTRAGYYGDPLKSKVFVEANTTCKFDDNPVNQGGNVIKKGGNVIKKGGDAIKKIIPKW